MNKGNIDNNSLAHTKWDCKYHIVFAPKYRRKVFYEEKRLEIREILRQLCQWKGVEIIEGEVCPEHIHILVSIPPKMSVSGFMGYLLCTFFIRTARAQPVTKLRWIFLQKLSKYKKFLPFYNNFHFFVYKITPL